MSPRTKWIQKHPERHGPGLPKPSSCSYIWAGKQKAVININHRILGNLHKGIIYNHDNSTVINSVSWYLCNFAPLSFSFVRNTFKGLIILTLFPISLAAGNINTLSSGFWYLETHFLKVHRITPVIDSASTTMLHCNDQFADCPLYCLSMRQQSIRVYWTSNNTAVNFSSGHDQTFSVYLIWRLIQLITCYAYGVYTIDNSDHMYIQWRCWSSLTDPLIHMTAFYPV